MNNNDLWVLIGLAVGIPLVIALWVVVFEAIA